MSLWRTVCHEVAGTTRSIRYDLSLLLFRRGRPTRRLVIAVGVLTALAAAGVGTAIAVVDSMSGATATDRTAPSGADSGITDNTDGVSLSGTDKASKKTGVSSSSAPFTSPEQTASPSPSTPSPTRPSPTRTRPPVPTPTSPTSPSTSPTPSPSGSPSISYEPRPAAFERT